MTGLKTAARVLRHQAGHLRSLVTRGRPAVFPSFTAMTLDEDDVALAEDWSARPEAWNDPEPVREFERAFAAWNGSGHARAFLGGRVALSACIDALELGPGAEVIVPGYTCVVVPNAFDFAGVKVVYADIELETYGPDATAVESKITDRTRAVLIQHLYGLVCRDYEAILDLARRRRLFVIEDCAHATGAEYRGVRVGNRGHMGFISTEQSKVFTTIQGGVAITGDPALARRLDAYAERAPFPEAERTRRLLQAVPLNYMRSKSPDRWWRADYAMLRFGRDELVSTTPQEERGERPAHYGRRMPAPLASIGRNQLRKLDFYNRVRRGHAARWHAWCGERGLPEARVIEDSVPVFLRYPTRVERERKRDRRWARREIGVELGVWYVSAVHPVNRPVKDCPRAMEAVATCVNLPTLLGERYGDGGIGE